MFFHKPNSLPTGFLHFLENHLAPIRHILTFSSESNGEQHKSKKGKKRKLSEGIC